MNRRGFLAGLVTGAAGLLVRTAGTPDVSFRPLPDGAFDALAASQAYQQKCVEKMASGAISPETIARIQAAIRARKSNPVRWHVLPYKVEVRLV